MQSFRVLPAEARETPAPPIRSAAAGARTIGRNLMTPPVRSAVSWPQYTARNPIIRHRCRGGDPVTRTRRAAAGLVILWLAFTGLASAFRQGRLIGKVLDPKGKPVAGVRVTTTSPTLPDFKETAVTDDKGVFKVDFEKIDIVYVYELEKAGYVP